jgi:hypothetical protein
MFTGQVRRLLPFWLGLLAGTALACNGRPPTAPQPGPLPRDPAAPAPAPVETVIRGYVQDSAFRPLFGARVEVLDGPQAGRFATTTRTGEFELSGAFDETTRFQATKEGYAAGTRVTNPYCGACNPHLWVLFALAPIDPPAPLAGNYTLTIVADSACTGLPDVARTRTYAVTVEPEPHPISPPGTFFKVALSGGRFVNGRDNFWFAVARDDIAVGIGEEGWGPGIHEQLSETRYLGIDGFGSVSVAAPTSTISTTFQGNIDYCELTSPVDSTYGCGPGQPTAHVACASTMHQLVLVRR